MTDWREELIEKMARYIACASSSEDDPESDWCYDNWPAYETQARAALAAAEPVIREECARIAASHNGCEISIREGQWCEAVNEIAAAIRDGGKDE